MSGNTPPGIVAVLINPSGNAVAHAADFDGSGYGGFSLRDAQRIRVERKIARAMINVFCSPVIGAVIEDYQAEQMLQKACNNHGFRMELVSVGHED